MEIVTYGSVFIDPFKLGTYKGIHPWYLGAVGTHPGYYGIQLLAYLLIRDPRIGYNTICELERVCLTCGTIVGGLYV